MTNPPEPPVIDGRLTDEQTAPLEEQLKHAYYYRADGSWGGSTDEFPEWDRWHAVAKVAIEAAGAHPSEHPWRCFHCGDVFHDTQAAEEHFGRSEYQEPVCRIDAARYREMEERVRRSNEEDTDLHREIHRLHNAHNVALQREEEAGYAKGLSDARAAAGAHRAEPLREAQRLLREGRQKLATYVSVYPGDKELRRLLSEWDAALSSVSPKGDKE